jgi:hypothetical protein
MLPLRMLGFRLGAMLGRRLPGWLARRLPAVLGRRESGREPSLAVTGVWMPDERADSDASSSADDEAPLASPSAKGEGWIGAEDVMARPPKACESAGTFGRLSPLGESTRWGE